MRGILLVLCCLLLSGVAEASYFPCLMTPAEMLTTGFAFMSPVATLNNNESNAQFNFVTEKGAVFTTVNKHVKAPGQVSFTAAELFPTVTQTGWVTAVNEVGADFPPIWIGGDFTTFADGGLGVDWFIEPVALTMLTADTQLCIANADAGVGLIRMTLYSQSGAQVGTTLRHQAAGRRPVSVRRLLRCASLEIAVCRHRRFRRLRRQQAFRGYGGYQKLRRQHGHRSIEPGRSAKRPYYIDTEFPPCGQRRFARIGLPKFRGHNELLDSGYDGEFYVQRRHGKRLYRTAHAGVTGFAQGGCENALQSSIGVSKRLVAG
jgi:hypothetical protein